MLSADFFLIVSSLVSLLLGLFILVSNPKKPVNRSLSAFLFSISIWLITNLLTNLAANPTISLWFARSTLIGAGALPYTFLLFCIIFTRQQGFNKKKAIRLAYVPLALLISLPTKLNIVSIGPNGTDTVTGIVYFFITPVVVAYFGWGLFLLVRFYRHKAEPMERAQLRYIFAGVYLTLIPIMIANVILPALEDTRAILYGPNAIILMAIFMSLAIIRHKFLDIRLIVVRSLAYILTVGTIGIFYGVGVFGVLGLFFSEGKTYLVQQVIYIGAAIFLALSFQSIKKFFDSVTNNLFYRDNYDPQIFIDQLNKVLVSTIDLQPLLNEASKIIASIIKAEFCAFYLTGTDHVEKRLIGINIPNDLDKNDLFFLEERTGSLRKHVLITSDLSSREHELNKNLQQHNIALAASISGTKDSIGSKLLLGNKKSGNPYNMQDRRALSIIANELSIAIQNSLRFEEIQQFNETLQEKIDHATGELRKSNQKLKALDAAKDEFVSMASHQLRTPLTSVKGYVSMVLDGDAGRLNAQQKDLLDQAFISTQRMVFLIADLLNVSRLKTGKFAIEAKPTYLPDVVEGEVGQLVDTAAAHQLELTYEKPQSFPMLNLDETKIRQVIMNFIDNAIYYTPANGHIKVSLASNDKAVELRVVDDGLGVPKAEQHHLFTKFFRAGNAKKARPDGTGLGLFMAQKVIVAQGGAIIFESEEGKGSTFGFSFPLSSVTIAPVV
jgi:signal transduction histidine kinase